MHLTDEDLERILREIARAAVEEIEREAGELPPGIDAGQAPPRQPQERLDLDYPAK